MENLIFEEITGSGTSKPPRDNDLFIYASWDLCCFVQFVIKMKYCVSNSLKILQVKRYF